MYNVEISTWYADDDSRSNGGGRIDDEFESESLGDAIDAFLDSDGEQMTATSHSHYAEYTIYQFNTLWAVDIRQGKHCFLHTGFKTRDDAADYLRMRAN